MTDRAESLWAKTLEILQAELSRPSFETWLKSTLPQRLEGNALFVQVPNDIARDWLETRYASIIRRALSDVAGSEMTVTFIVPARRAPSLGSTGEASSAVDAAELGNRGSSSLEQTAGGLAAGSAVLQPAPSDSPRDNASVTTGRGGAARAGLSAPDRSSEPPQGAAAVPEEVVSTALNPKYTFESFVVGNSNRFAHAAALAVATGPGKAYNPLFIYGGVGLGKTHLMQAIGHHILAQRPTLKVVYVSSEKFTNDLINAIRDDKTVDFKERYRGVDILLVDDIQFLAGKERTQEEFFHTFNALYEAGKQIVVSSDRPPKEIPTLEDRLRSRFEWGLIADIQVPDLETRIAILQKKASSEGLVIPQEVLEYIANQIPSNIRELEGALIRVAAYSSLINGELTVQVAEGVLKDILPSTRPKKISIDRIQQAVALFYHIDPEELRAKKRTRTVSLPRHIAMYLCRELTEASLPKIGEEFGGRDHSTVIHAYEKIQGDIRQDAALAATVNEIINRLKGNRE